MNNRTPAAAAAPAAKRSKWVSCLVTAVLALNTFCLVAVLVAVLGVRSRVETTLDKVDTIIAEVSSGHPSKGLIDTTNTIISAASSYFFLGASDGTIAGYIQNLFEFDFAGLGSAAVNFATKVETAWAGTTASSNSVDRAIVTGARAVKSIGGKVATFQNVNAAAATNPAMSEGIFRLDTLLQFVQSQTDVAAWKAGGGVCSDMADQLSKVVWSGSWSDADGTQRDWNIQRTMGNVTSYMHRVCDKLKTLN